MIPVERYQFFLASLPTTSDVEEWLNQFRRVFEQFIGESVRIVVHINHLYRIATPGHEAHVRWVADLTRTRKQPIAWSSSLQHRDAGRLLKELLEPSAESPAALDGYRPPVVYSYHDAASIYIATLFLFTEESKPALSAEAQDLIRSLDPFLRFLFTDMIARTDAENSWLRLLDRTFEAAAAEAKLTPTETMVLMIFLHGHGHREVVLSLGLRLDVVKRHSRNALRKMGVQCFTELLSQLLKSMHWHFRRIRG